MLSPYFVIFDVACGRMLCSVTWRQTAPLAAGMHRKMYVKWHCVAWKTVKSSRYGLTQTWHGVERNNETGRKMFKCLNDRRGRFSRCDQRETGGGHSSTTWGRTTTRRVALWPTAAKPPQCSVATILRYASTLGIFVSVVLTDPVWSILCPFLGWLRDLAGPEWQESLHVGGGGSDLYPCCVYRALGLAVSWCLANILRGSINSSERAVLSGAATVCRGFLVLVTWKMARGMMLYSSKL